MLNPFSETKLKMAHAFLGITAIAVALFKNESVIGRGNNADIAFSSSDSKNNGFSTTTYRDIVGSLYLGVDQVISDDEHANEVRNALRETVRYYHEVFDNNSNKSSSIHEDNNTVANTINKDKCKNRHESCTYWKVIGECAANPNYMEKQVNNLLFVFYTKIVFPFPFIYR